MRSQHQTPFASAKPTAAGKAPAREIPYDAFAAGFVDLTPCLPAGFRSIGSADAYALLGERRDGVPEATITP